MCKISFIEKSLDELKDYTPSEQKLIFQVLELIRDIDKSPFEGLGKPEALRGKLQGL